MKIFNFKFDTNLRNNIELLLADKTLNRLLSSGDQPNLFSRALTKQIIHRFGGALSHNINPHTGNLGFGLIHYSLILNIKPDKVLCIGSQRGFIPAICALACKENKKGIVDFVDAGYGLESKNHWGGIALWKRVEPDQYFSYLDINKYMNIHVMRTDEFARKNKNRYQYIYIDGNHSYKGVKRDYQLFWPKLQKNGFMSFHDTRPKKMPNVPPLGVWKLWKELKENKIILPFGTGLGIIQKI